MIVVSRDAIILLGALVVYIVKQQINIHPTRWGKLTTTFQMLSVVAVFLQLKLTPLLWWVAAGWTLVSGLDYVRRGFKTLYASDNQRAHH